MTQKLPLTDFRAVRSKLEPADFASSEGQDAPPSDLIDPEVWDGMMHLPDDVAIRISDHNGVRLSLLYSLWGDWITAVGDPDRPDEIFNCMLDATDCFQCANFNLLHGFYRAALAELRVALELLMIGAYGSLNPTDAKYIEWKMGLAELGFTRCRKHLLGTLDKASPTWFFENGGLVATTYQKLCNYTHSRPNASDGALWQSNGPVYRNESIKLTFVTTLLVFAICYLLVRIARRDFVMPKDSDILFELDWMPDHAKLVRAFTELFGRAPRPPAKQ